VPHYKYEGSAVFFNLFSEAEPFATILVAHGTHVFLGGEGRLLIKAESGGGFLGRGQHQLGSLEECCKPPQRGSG